MQFKKWIKQLPIYGEFGSGVFWNIGSLAILGICGILWNVLIAKFFGLEVLGVFNQVFALYILFSQIAVGGVHFSVLKYVSEFFNNKKKCNTIISSAIILTIFFSVLSACLMFLLRDIFGIILDSPAVSKAIIYIIPAIVLFALNKVFLSVLNGFRHMKNYAVSQALRYILIIAILFFAIIFGFSGYTLPVVFTGAEFLLLIWLLFSISKFYSFTLVDIKKWTKKHFVFGMKAILSGTLIEINTRVDVLMLGIFLSDKIVGIYSLAAILSEGISQIYIAIRANINPILTRLYTQNRIKQLKFMIKRGVKLFYLAMTGIGLISIVIYPLFLNLVLNTSEFSESWYVFIILMLGIVISSGYLPFNMLLTQTGFPGYHTLYIGSIVFVNIAFNSALIPILGMYGAALATALSFVFSAIFLKIWAKKLLHINI